MDMTWERFVPPNLVRSTERERRTAERIAQLEARIATLLHDLDNARRHIAVLRRVCMEEVRLEETEGEDVRNVNLMEENPFWKRRRRRKMQEADVESEYPDLGPIGAVRRRHEIREELAGYDV